ncbi:MAG: ABC transporter substrate-binding protein [Chloroflexota bacterium]
MYFRKFTILVLLTLLLVSVVPLSAQDPTECEDGFRLFDHEMLATEAVCIPENPERVVLVWPLGLPSFFRADVPIVGSFALDFLKGQHPAWVEEIDMLTDIGTPANPEAVLALEPDLIIGAYYLIQDESTSTYPDFVEADPVWTSIAPTVVFDWNQTTWRETEDLIMDAVGKSDESDAIFTEFEARAQELAMLIDNVGDIEVAMINFGANFFNLHTQNSPGGIVAEMVGFGRVEAHLLPVSREEFLENRDDYPEYLSEAYLTVNQENLDIIDADMIIISGGFFENNPDNQEALDDLLANPLWQTLEAVQNGNVHLADINFGNGEIAAAHAMLDDFAEAFGVADEFSSNPYLEKAPIPELNMEEDMSMGEIAQGFNEAGFPLTLTDFEGREVTLEEAPQRILIANRAYTLGPMLALGVVPVQLHTFPWDFVEEGEVLPWEEEALVELGANPEQFINTNDQYSLEVFASANPDIIFIDGRVTAAVDGLIDQLDAIAPTIQTAGARDWRANILTIADAIGQPEAGEQLVAEVEGKIDAVADQAEALGATGNTFAVVSFQPDQVFVCTDQEYGPTNLMLTLGLEMTPEIAELGSNVCTPLSLETVDLLNDTDYLLIFQFGGLTVDEAREQAVIDLIPALQEGRFDFIPDSALGIAFDDINPLSIDILLPTLESAVEKAAQAE